VRSSFLTANATDADHTALIEFVMDDDKVSTSTELMAFFSSEGYDAWKASVSGSGKHTVPDSWLMYKCSGKCDKLKFLQETFCKKQRTLNCKDPERPGPGDKVTIDDARDNVCQRYKYWCNMCMHNCWCGDPRKDGNTNKPGCPKLPGDVDFLNA